MLNRDYTPLFLAKKQYVKHEKEANQNRICLQGTPGEDFSIINAV